jgi:hypothetical protein
MSNQDDVVVRAEHYRARASEFSRKADDALDDTVQMQLRFVAARYLRLAEAEEFASQPAGPLS